MYIRHTLIAWVQFLWSRPQTANHVVLARKRSKDRARARTEMEQGAHVTGPTRRQSTHEKDCARAEMEQEQSKRDHARDQRRKQKDTTSEQSKAKEKECDRYSHDTF